MRRLLLAPLILSLVSPLNAGIPEKNRKEWMKWPDESLGIFHLDTQNVQVTGQQIKFWVSRTETDNEEQAGNFMTYNWTGKLRVDCGNFKERMTRTDGGGGPLAGLTPWSKIQPTFFHVN